jgi:hypothetical protein
MTDSKDNSANDVEQNESLREDVALIQRAQLS